jgi:hypothetical protein
LQIGIKIIEKQTVKKWHMLNFQKDSDPVTQVPSQHVIYDFDGASFKFYRKDLKKGSGYLYAEPTASIQNAAGTPYGATEALVRAALDPIIGVIKTV